VKNLKNFSINKIKDMQILKKLRFILVVLAISLFACHPYLNKILPYAHDLGYHLNRINEMCKQIILGNFPVLIHSEILNGLGYANSLFYPEVFLYIPVAFIYFLKFDLIDAYKIFIVIITFFTFLSMYYTSMKIFKKKQIAWLSTILYTFSLYRLTDVYVRGAVGELLTFIFLPLIVAGLYEVIFDENKKWWLIAIGLFGIANSHMLSFAMTIPLILFICLINVDKIFKDKKRLLNLVIAAIVSVIITVGFFGPLIEQKCNDKFFVDGNSREDAQIIKDRATSIDLALSNRLKVGDGVNSNITDAALSEGIGIILLILPVLIFFSKDISYKNNRYCIQMLAIAGITYLMTTLLFPWDKLQALSIIQFPFRLNIIPTVLLSLVGAFAFYNFVKNKNDMTVIFTIVILLTASNQLDQLDINVFDYQLEQFMAGVGREVGMGEYLPEGVDLGDVNLYNINDKESKIEFTRKGSEITFEYDNKELDMQINIPFIYYKGYKAYIEEESGKVSELLVSKNEQNAHVLVSSDEKLEGKIIVKYEMTNVQKICYTISFIALFALGVYIVVSLVKNKK